MTRRLSTLERAYELARSGDCPTVTAIRAQLKAERFDDVAGQLYGPTIQEQLRRLCKESQRPPE